MANSEIAVWGVNCSWWNTLDRASTTGSGLPCCPHCGSVLMEAEITKWWTGVEEHEARGNIDYRAFVEWQRGQCFRNIAEAQQVWQRNRK